MTRYVTVDMVVDNVGEMAKTGAKCILKGEATIDGMVAKFGLTIACDDAGLFDELNIDQQHLKIEMILQDSAQTTLIDE